MPMEGFENVVRLYMERRGFVVATNVKFKLAKKTKKQERDEVQTHGYEVDIVAARANQLLLGEVKSFFGSAGVQRKSFAGLASKTNSDELARYRLFNDADHREQLIAEACKRYGYELSQVRVALFVGHFKRGDEDDITRHLKSLSTKGGPIEVYGPKAIAADLMTSVLADGTYADDPVVSTLRLLEEVGVLSNAKRA